MDEAIEISAAVFVFGALAMVCGVAVGALRAFLRRNLDE